MLLARRGRAVPAEVLLDLVWGDDARRLTATTVHTVVARLRRHLGGDLVRTTDAGYLVPHDVATDADRFAGLVGSGADGSASRLREALDLWVGDTAYEGVRDDLVLAERTRLADLHRRARADLAAVLLDTAGEAEALEALALARTLLADDPLDEGAAVLAMRAAYRAHRQGAALEVHDTLRRTLRDELGVAPGRAVRELHARVLAHDPTLDGPPTGARDRDRDADPATTRPGATPEPPPVALHPGRLVPVPASPTVGRDDDVAVVLGALAEGRRLVTVTGPGGVGKTRLLADVGAALQPHGEVVHVALGAHAALPVDELAASVALATGVPLSGDDPVAGLVAALRTSTATVLADEAEWVLGSAAELTSTLLAGCPGLRVVITSRVPLSVVGERVVVLEPLPTPGPDASAAEVCASPAVRMLAERLADHGAGPTDPSAWGEADLRVLGEVARRVDGLPLALELVAGAGARTPLADLLDVARQPLDLAGAEHGRDDRHRSLRDALSWGVGRLGPGARVVLRRLGVFVGPFTTAAARAVVGPGDPGLDVERAVRELARHHLLRVERTSTTLSFRMLRVVRDLALDELAAAGEVDATRERHRRWFAGVWRDAPLSDDLVEHVGRTHDDHVEALVDALEHDDDVAAADIALALSRRWQFVEASTTGLRWTTRLLGRPGTTRVQRARLRVARAGFLQGADWDDAEHGRLRADLADDPEWSGLLGLVSAITAYVSGDPATARHHIEDALAATVRAPHLLPEVVAAAAVFDATEGDAAAAITGARDALARLGSPVSAVHLVSVVPKAALALLEAGHAREALDLLTSAARDADARFGIRPTNTTTLNAGWAALSVDDPTAALGWFRDSLTGTQTATAAPTVGEAALGAGATLAALGGSGAAELLGLGRLLLAEVGQELPPALEALVARAEEAVGVTAPPAGWDATLATGRVAALVRGAGAQPAR
ncbi:BTAD domain-containing putative transcriptional regulator [Oryzobacter terrae]|uniref:BTAD domain-containing putative transcriptional regulator n=1 Tax=Oryzobacter terrae TaxID=1620385 RepID=UPI003670C42D